MDVILSFGSAPLMCDSFFFFGSVTTFIHFYIEVCSERNPGL